MDGGGETTRSVTVGIWMPLPSGSQWRGEGIGRTVEFLLSGFRQRGHLGTRINFVFVTSPWVTESLRQSVSAILGGDLRGISFHEVGSAKYRFVRLVDRIFSLGGRISVDPYMVSEPDLTWFETRRSASEIFRYQTSGRDLKIARTLGAGRLRGDVAEAFGIERPPVRTKGLKLWTVSGFRQFFSELKREARYNRGPWKTVSAKLSEEEDQRPMLPGLTIAKSLAGALQKVPVLGWIVGAAVWVLRRVMSRADAFSLTEAASGVEDQIEVDLWWIPSPTIGGTEFLRQPKLVNFWDFVVGEYGHLWPEPELARIVTRVSMALHMADQVVTQSFHNKESKLLNAFQIDRSKVSVCYLTVPLQYRRYVPSFEATGTKSLETKLQAATAIRKYVQRKLLRTYRNRVEGYRHRGLELERLEEFKFESELFAVVSTQNRPYKNVAFLVDAYLWMIDRYGLDAYLFLTCPFELDDKKDVIGRIILKRNGVGRVFSLPRVPNAIHASLYHTASCTLHPSLSEGGVGSYPFMEGMAMGTPGLAASGDYMTEGRRLHPDYDAISFSSRDRRAAAKKIASVLKAPEQAYVDQLSIFESHNRWTWADVADVYTNRFQSLAGVKPLALDALRAAKPMYFDVGADGGRADTAGSRSQR